MPVKLIVPCAGRSSRYPNMPPKWTLPDSDGQPMLLRSIEGIDFAPEDLIVVVLREHEERFGVLDGLRRAVGDGVSVVVLEEPTRSQSETVAMALRETRVEEPFMVKDSDNTFRVLQLPDDANYVCVESLNHFDQINPRNKSYVAVDENMAIRNIREKVVISDLFCVGGYHFSNPQRFLEVYDRLDGQRTEWHREIYISDVIGSMLLDGDEFVAVPAEGYEDWGTVKEWAEYLARRKTVFVPLDGFLFYRGSAVFRPLWYEASVIDERVDTVRRYSADGHVVVFVSNRPEDVRDETTMQLQRLGLDPTHLVMGIPVAGWSMVHAREDGVPIAAPAVDVVDSDSVV